MHEYFLLPLEQNDDRFLPSEVKVGSVSTDASPNVPALPPPIASEKPGFLANSRDLLPGVALCLAISLVSVAAQALEERVLEHPYVEALVMAILLGIAVRTALVAGCALSNRHRVLRQAAP